MLSTEVQIGGMLIKCTGSRNEIRDRVRKMKEIVAECIKNQMFEENKDIIESVNSMVKHMTIIPKSSKNPQGRPNTIEEWDSLNKFIRIESEEKLKDINTTIENSKLKIALLDKEQLKMSGDDLHKCWLTFGYTREVFISRKENLRKLEQLKYDFSETLKENARDLSNLVKEIADDLELLEREDELDKYVEIGGRYQIIGDRIKKAQEDATLINSREKILSYKPSIYPLLPKIAAQYQPFQTLWTLVSDYYFNYPKWMNDYLNQIQREELTETITSAIRTLRKLEKNDLKDSRSALENAATMAGKYQEMMPYLPTICDLRNPALKYL